MAREVALPASPAKRETRSEVAQQLSEYLLIPEQCESYYLPHHAVIREESQKIRVVFNASQKAVNKLSLNDVLLSGPKLQADITIVLTQWRFQRYVFITDIVKMFRQILIHPDDADWQRIVWRPSDTEPVRDYRALTVTYGTSPAPFLALRVLQQLAQDGRTTHPEASRLLRQQVYVDDIFGGADDIDTARQRRDQLIQLLATAGMELGKWSANEPALLQGLAVKNSIEVPVQTNEVVSTLGLKWLPQNDYFIFEAALPPIVSKRILLSDVARLFDPLGWISPVLITAKIIMQELWIQKIDWDSPIQGVTFQQWIQFRNSLSDLKIINVPRWVGCLESTDWQLHGFLDASKRAYAAAVYSVIPGQRSTLLMAKSSVAPTKLETLPRLELCGALLLTRLTKHILSKLDRQPSNIYFWSDSKVVLDWLRGHPSRWQTFVANRVSEIVSSFPQAEWHHVVSSFNAVDYATRGLTPQQLAEHKLWWSGPPWITSPRNEWPSAINEQRETQMLSAQEAVNESPGNHDCLSNLQRFSNFSKIRRILAYVARWRCNASRKANERQLAFLTAQELSIATTYCYRAIQRRHFSAELDLLRANKPVHKRSSVARLAPFIDENDLLRVGGRLGNAPLPYNERHPIILPGNEIIVKHLVRQIHVTTLHGGVQLMCSQLRQTVWITRGHDIVTRVFRACCKCSRHNPKVGQQQMAPLPATRVTPQRPFAVVGLDYAGPVPVLFSRGRGAKSTKGYVSIFVCFAVRAVHIEIVSDLTAQAFLAAFDRFTARRGLCHTIYSDNATTFKGASAELTRMFAEASNFNQQVACQLANRGTTWKFIPPRAPHFGGLWEAAVRRFKYHFKRVIGEATLTFEELSTLAAKIEACMNSRPLCPLSTEPTELAVLTPGHFLVGSPLLSHPEAVAESPALRGRSRWHLLCQMRNSFWQRWRNEVLHHLQQRNKWLHPQPNLQVNDIVLLKDELAPPARWPLGRITALHPGGDGLVRAVTVKTADSSFVRPIVKLVKLPADSDAEEQHLQLASQNRKT